MLPLIFSMLFLAWGLRSLHRKRLIDDTPTLKTMGVFIGLAEIKGTAESENPLSSYITGAKCVQYSWSIEEHWSRQVTETVRDADGKTRTRTRTESGWRTVDHGGESPAFYLKDDTGAIRIDPKNASIDSDTSLNVTVGRSDPLYYGRGPLRAVAHSRHRRRFTETLIPLHAPLYVIGQARERQDRVAAEIAYDEEEPLFVISTRNERQVSSGYRNRFLILGALGFILSILVPSLLVESTTPIPLASGIIYVVASILGWSLVVYNSLVGLRNSVDQAWSTIDIQLKRRSDLMPNLVEIIEGYQEHEEEVQVQTATLRAQTMNQEKPMGVAPLLQSVAEAYPELKAGKQFLQLQRILEETEQRIAIARDYYNQQTRFYNTRLEVIPDMYVARLGGLKQRPLWEAENFQRAQEEIDFAS
jgi:hypothetical protein